jgi:hypothetical protein
MFSSMILPLIPMAIMVGALYLIVRKFKRRGCYSPFTDDFLREPGETLRTQHSLIQDEIMECFFSLVVVGVVAVYVVKGFPLVAVVTALVVFVIFFIYQLKKLSGLFSKAVSVRLGFEGERATGQELMMLMRDRAGVYHDIPYKYGNIDHIVIAPGGVFAFETKAVSKPASETTNRAEWKVTYDGKSLAFPHREDSAALEQARRHAKYLHGHIKKKLGIHAVVTPVVSIPGWFIDRTGKSDVWVINPKERDQLRKEMVVAKLGAGEADIIAAHIESVARSIRPGSKKLDPDAEDYYDFWNNPKYQPPSVD